MVDNPTTREEYVNGCIFWLIYLLISLFVLYIVFTSLE